MVTAEMVMPVERSYRVGVDRRIVVCGKLVSWSTEQSVQSLTHTGLAESDYSQDHPLLPRWEHISCFLNRICLGELQRTARLDLTVVGRDHLYPIAGFLLMASRAARAGIAVIPDVCCHGLDGVSKRREEF